MLCDVSEQCFVACFAGVARVVHYFCEPFVIALVHRSHPLVEEARASAKFVNRGSVAIHQPGFSRHSGRWPVSVGIDLLPILASSDRTQGTALGRFREASVLAM